MVADTMTVRSTDERGASLGQADSVRSEMGTRPCWAEGGQGRKAAPVDPTIRASTYAHPRMSTPALRNNLRNGEQRAGCLARC